MKIKFLLFALALGFVCLDLACRRDNSNCKSLLYEVIGINPIRLNEVIPIGGSQSLNRDSVAFDSLLFVVTFNEKLISSNYNFSFINSAYATPPCPLPYTDWELDSIVIFSFDNNVKTDFTDQFSLSKMKVDHTDDNFLRELNHIIRNSPIRMEFQLLNPPLKTGTFQFIFQFHDKNGSLFEKMSDPVVITP